MIPQVVFSAKTLTMCEIKSYPHPVPTTQKLLPVARIRCCQSPTAMRQTTNLQGSQPVGRAKPSW